MIGGISQDNSDNNSQIPTNQIQPISTLNTTQILTSLFISQNGEIFIGTKYWLSIYYFVEGELKAKNHVSIGSKINNIDSNVYENYRYVALALSDGFVHILKIKYDEDQMSIDSHERASIYYGEAKLVSLINYNTMVSVGDNSTIAIITKKKTWNHEIHKRNNNNTITALKYFNDEIYIGYENGEVEILTIPEMETSKTKLQFKNKILGFYFNSFPIIVTEKSYHELDEFLNDKYNFSFPITANKASIIFDNVDNKNIQKMVISDSNQINIYINNEYCPFPGLSSKDVVSLSFLGDVLIIESSQTVSIYCIPNE